jgi:hypothetical protein
MNTVAMHIVKNRLVKLATAAAAAFALSACGAAPQSVAGTDAPDGETNAAVKSTIVLGKVGVLSKTSAIDLRKLVLTAVSSAVPADTVRDTIPVSGNAQVTVTRVLTLAPLRTWTVGAKSLDARDSVIHQGSTAGFFVKPADTAAVTLNLTARYSMYEARFNSLPDSIASSVSGTGMDKLNLNRVTLLVDGVAKADSLLPSGYFASGQNVTVFWDYIAPGNHTVTLEAYGTLHAYTGKLYSGSATFSSTAGADDARSVTLNWVGPTTGTGKLTVTLGKVGKVTINGGLPGTVIP